MKQVLKGLIPISTRIAIIVVSFLLVYSSCTKNTSAPTLGSPTGPIAYIAVADASPSTSLYSVYSDSTNVFPGNTIRYGAVTGLVGGSPYEMLNPGNHFLKLSTNGTTYPIDSNFNFSANDFYTVFVYDTANSSGQLKTLILKDNLSMPASGQAEFRFLNLSPSPQALDLSFVNRDTTAGTAVLLRNIEYVGNSGISSDSLSSFRSIAPGVYRIDLNSNSIESQHLSTTDSVNISVGEIYTFYARGYVNGVNGTDSLGLGMITNF